MPGPRLPKEAVPPNCAKANGSPAPRDAGRPQADRASGRHHGRPAGDPRWLENAIDRAIDPNIAPAPSERWATILDPHPTTGPNNNWVLRSRASGRPRLSPPGSTLPSGQTLPARPRPCCDRSQARRTARPPAPPTATGPQCLQNAHHADASQPQPCRCAPRAPEPVVHPAVTRGGVGPGNPDPTGFALMASAG